jgi:hypothetical protein
MGSPTCGICTKNKVEVLRHEEQILHGSQSLTGE